MTIRNNLVEMSGTGTDHRAFSVQMSSTVPGYPVPNNVRFYNNTAFSSDTGNNFQMVNTISQTGTVTNIVARNNLGYAPTDAAPVMFNGTFASLLNNTCDSNLCATRVKTSPLFATTPPSAPAHYLLGAGSYALDAGDNTVPVFSDFFRVDRPQGAAKDIGATEQ
jgi:hypothetical protein